MKIWVRYSLSPRLRHLGHLDLMRALQRALRRSSLPVAYSQGFNPHILLSIAAPLSVGQSGEGEVMEVPLEQAVSEEAFVSRLNDALPPGIRAEKAVLKEDGTPTAMSQVFAASYEIAFPEGDAGILEHIGGYLAQSRIETVKRGKKGDKTVDLRPLIFNLLARDGRLYATLALCEAGTARADQVVDTLAKHAGAEKPLHIARRTNLLDGRFVPLVP